MSRRSSIAVIIPVRDAATLGLCLAALTRGQRVPDELVVVDDGSSSPVDPTKLPSGARLLVLPPSGPGAARNAGAAATTAELLVFVDADVEVAEPTLARLEAIYAEGEKLALQCVYDPRCPVDTFPARVHNTLQRYNLLSVGDEGGTTPRRLRGLSSFCVAIARTAFEAAGGFEERVRRATIEDDVLGLALARIGADVWVLPDVTVRHHARPTVSRLLGRMAAMAEDRASMGALGGTLGALASGRTHHRPAFLAAVLLTAAAPFVPPAAPALVGLSLAVQWRAVAALAREHGAVTAVLGAPLLVGLAGAAALGSARGLGRRVASTVQTKSEVVWGS